jgi:hypothetical protein
MASLAKVTVNWAGWPGAPGYTNLYFRNSTPGVISQAVVDNAITKVEAWKNDFDQDLPSGLTVTTDPSVEEIDDTNGSLIGFWTGSPGAGTSGAAAGNYSNAAGFCIAWSTNTVRNSRRMRGRTFVVPIGSSGLDNTGSLATTRLTAWKAAAAALRANTGDARLVIWGRPTAPGATDGVSAEVTSSNIVDKTAILTSRRE